MGKRKSVEEGHVEKDISLGKRANEPFEGTTLAKGDYSAGKKGG